MSATTPEELAEFLLHEAEVLEFVGPLTRPDADAVARNLRVAARGMLLFERFAEELDALRPGDNSIDAVEGFLDSNGVFPPVTDIEKLVAYARGSRTLLLKCLIDLLDGANTDDRPDAGTSDTGM